MAIVDRRSDVRRGVARGHHEPEADPGTDRGAAEGRRDLADPVFRARDGDRLRERRDHDLAALGGADHELGAIRQPRRCADDDHPLARVDRDVGDRIERELLSTARLVLDRAMPVLSFTSDGECCQWFHSVL